MCQRLRYACDQNTNDDDHFEHHLLWTSCVTIEGMLVFEDWSVGFWMDYPIALYHKSKPHHISEPLFSDLS